MNCINIIFDLDGTLTPQRPASNSPFSHILLPNVREKLTELRAAGCRFAIASNQGGAKRNKPNRLTVGAILAQMGWARHELGIDIIRFAISDNYKKPNPAMLLEICREWNISPTDAVFVGDAETDRQAAFAAGIKFIYAKEFFK